MRKLSFKIFKFFFNDKILSKLSMLLNHLRFRIITKQLRKFFMKFSLSEEKRFYQLFSNTELGDGSPSEPFRYMKFCIASDSLLVTNYF